MANTASRGISDCSLMKSAPRRFRSSTARRPSSGVVIAIELGKRGCGPSSIGPTDHHARPDQRPGSNLLAPLLQHFQLAAHVAHARNAIGDEQRQRDLLPAWEPVSEDHVDMHVPEPWDQELARPIHMHALQLPADASRGTADLLDFSVAHNHRAMRLRRPAGHINDGDVMDDQNGRRGRLPGRCRKRTTEDRARKGCFMGRILGSRSR